MEKIKIAFIIDTLNLGGTELQLVSLIKRLNQDKFEPYLICLRDSDRSESLRLNCKKVILDVRKLASYRGIKSLIWVSLFLRRRKIDILQAFFIDSNIFGVIAGTFGGVRTIVSSRRDLGFWYSAKLLWILKILDRWVDHYLVNSHSITITRGLTGKGYRVATAKHIPEVDFTIDTKEKDTWKHAQAGASMVFAVSPKELAVIKKMDTAELDLNYLVRQCEDEVDVLVLEGFRKLVAKDPSIPKIVTIKKVSEFAETQRVFEPILAFQAPQDLKAKKSRIPTVDALKEPEKLVEIVNKRIGPVIMKRKTERDGLNVIFDEKTLPLNMFVQQYVRNVVLAMLSELKTADIKGNESVSIRIRRERISSTSPRSIWGSKKPT